MSNNSEMEELIEKFNEEDGLRAHYIYPTHLGDPRPTSERPESEKKEDTILVWWRSDKRDRVDELLEGTGGQLSSDITDTPHNRFDHNAEVHF